MCLWILNSPQTAGNRQPTVWNKNVSLQITHYWGTFPIRPQASRQSSFHFDGSYSVELAFLQNPIHLISSSFWNTPPKTFPAQKVFAKLLWPHTSSDPGLSGLVGFGFVFFLHILWGGLIIYLNNFFALITFHFTLASLPLRTKSPSLLCFTYHCWISHHLPNFPGSNDKQQHFGPLKLWYLLLTELTATFLKPVILLIWQKSILILTWPAKLEEDSFSRRHLPIGYNQNVTNTKNTWGSLDNVFPYMIYGSPVVFYHCCSKWADLF